MVWFKKTPRRIYLDYASATPLLPQAATAMRDAEMLVGNPGAIHKEAVEAKRALEGARERIALILGVKAREMIFTSGLTESNNLAIIGFAKQLERVKRSLSGTHWIVSAIEHASVLESFSEIERLGGDVSHVMPNEKGIITPEAVSSALKPETVFVSVGWANNEIGTIQPLAKIAQAIRAHEEKHKTKVIFHADAGQAPLYERTLVHSLGVDLLSLSASKLYGPHGVGALFVSNRAQLAGVIVGGEQERGLRAGTENAALSVGFAAAFEIIGKERFEEATRLQQLRDVFAKELISRNSHIVINGDPKHSLPHMLNISILGIDTEYLSLRLDHAGIAVSTKSACNEGEKASHVVEALGGKVPRAEHTLRFSFGRETTEDNLTKTAEILHIVLNS